MKLKSLIPEQKEIKYIQPNFDAEWNEAERYPEFVEMGRLNWIKIGKSGYIVNFSDIKDVLGNVDLNFDGLEPIKKKFVLQYINDGLVEYPIVVKFSDNDYDLVAGNTRLSGLVKFGYVQGLYGNDNFYIESIDPSDAAWVIPGYQNGTSLVGTFLFPATFTPYISLINKGGWC